MHKWFFLWCFSFFCQWFFYLCFTPFFLNWFLNYSNLWNWMLNKCFFGYLVLIVNYFNKRLLNCHTFHLFRLIVGYSISFSISFIFSLSSLSLTTYLISFIFSRIDEFYISSGRSTLFSSSILLKYSISLNWSIIYNFELCYVVSSKFSFPYFTINLSKIYLTCIMNSSLCSFNSKGSKCF